MTSVKLLSGWSNPGGSTHHHIALTNLLNSKGVECVFYGPHDYHLDKCKSDTLDKLQIGPEHILISHFLHVPNDPTWKKHILSCHETNIFPLSEVNLEVYDTIQYVSQSQKDWHGVDHSSVIIPPMVEKVKWKNPENKCAGVIGSIDPHKRPHLSIQAALDDGYDKVFLFGDITDREYFNKEVAPYVNRGEAVMQAHESDRKALYGQIEAVYHSSLRETYGLVEAECRLAGIPFRGESNNQVILTEDEIWERWEDCLNQ
tara:strand:+ start:2254 stop:3030 length:777 start_codon:yes stop_codon:yes gene_type:complete